ncbi:MAG: flagellar biosynthesis protein FlhF [Ferrimonas sp.]
MKIKRFFAKDMRTALVEVKETLGNDAVIMSNKRVTGGVEIVAAVDVDKGQHADTSSAAVSEQPAELRAPSAPSANRNLDADRVSLSGRADPMKAYGANQAGPLTAAATASAGGASSLRELLEQQQRRQEQAASADSVQPSKLSQRLAEQERALGGNTSPSSVPPPVAAPATGLPQWAKQAFQEEPIKVVETPTQRVGKNGTLLASTPAETESASSADIVAMRDEMASIRALLQHQVSNLMEQGYARDEPVLAMVQEQLRDCGFNKQVAKDLAQLLPKDGELHELLAQLPQLVASQLICQDDTLLNEGGVFAFVGSTGIGKTTTIAKLAARFAARFGIDQVALITTDNYRIGARDQLQTYGKIMGCPVRSAANMDELEHTLYQLRSRRLVLIDTAGMSQRDMRLVEQLDQLSNATHLPIKSFLVLSAAAQYKVLRETVDKFSQIELSGCIVTKLDEAHSIGEVLSVLLQTKLPVCYLTVGQRVPEDLRVADAHYLACRALSEESMQSEPSHAEAATVAEDESAATRTGSATATSSTDQGERL